MARGRRLAGAVAATALALATLVAAGCGGDDNSAAGTSSAGAGSDLSGDIAIDGSSTVGPLTSAAAEAFNGQNSGVNVTVGTSGTGGGFELFCKGETDISDASRTIKPEEATACKSGGVTYVELRVASDGITLVTNNPSNVGGNDSLTMAQLKAIWAPDSKINNWKDIPGGSFNDVPLTLAGPDSQSGTYDFFNEKVIGTDASGNPIDSRQDYSASADDNVTVRAVQSAEGGLGYFGYTYFEENKDTLTDFAVDGVKPTAATITDGTYPLSRPLFIYVKKTSLAKPEVKAFVEYYLKNAIPLSKSQQFVPAPQAALNASLAKINN
jgi:phosphate transport system substrate-binding protein